MELALGVIDSIRSICLGNIPLSSDYFGVDDYTIERYNGMANAYRDIVAYCDRLERVLQGGNNR